ncbi:MAG: class I SAM-dependent methyltransferase [Microbacteriaceae bacterium]
MTEEAPDVRDSAEPAGPWNHSIQYFPFILGLVGEKPRANALDVGSGDGMLAVRIAETVPAVVGLDLAPTQVAAAARRYADVPGLRFECGDVLSHTPAGAPFDVVTCSAVLHHLPLEPALVRLRELTAPGGTLIVVGLLVERSLLDWLFSLASILPNRLARARRGWHDHGAPRADPRDGFGTVRHAARRALPGAQLRHRLYWRYTIVWQRPVG